MVFVRFSLKAFYVIAIALGISFIYGMAGFGFLESGIGEEALGDVFMPSYVLGLGVIVALTEKWWRLSDPMATIHVWGLSVRFYGYALILLALYLFGDFIFVNGWNNELQSVILFTLVANGLCVGLYFLKKWFKTKRGPHTANLS